MELVRALLSDSGEVDLDDPLKADLPTTYYLLPTSYLLPTTDYLLVTTYYLLLTTYDPRQGRPTYYLLPTSYLLPTIDYLLLTTDYLLLTTYDPRQVARLGPVVSGRRTLLPTTYYLPLTT